MSPHCESLQIISPPCFESKSSFLQSKTPQEKFELKNSVTLRNWKSASAIILHLEFKYSITFNMATGLRYNFQKSNCKINKKVKTAINLRGFSLFRTHLHYFSFVDLQRFCKWASLIKIKLYISAYQIVTIIRIQLVGYLNVGIVLKQISIKYAWHFNTLRELILIFVSSI